MSGHRCQYCDGYAWNSGHGQGYDCETRGCPGSYGGSGNALGSGTWRPPKTKEEVAAHREWIYEILRDGRSIDECV